MFGYAGLLAAMPLPGPAPRHERPRPVAGVLLALRDRRVWLLAALLAALDVFDEPFFAFLMAALERVRDLPPAATVLVAGLGSAGSVAGAVISERRPPKPARAATALLVAVAVIVMVPSAATAALAAPIVGGAAVALWVRTQSMILGLRAGQAGTTMAVVSSIAVVGDLFPLLAGWVADRAGLGAALGCYVGAAMALLALVGRALDTGGDGRPE